MRNTPLAWLDITPVTRPIGIPNGETYPLGNAGQRALKMSAALFGIATLVHVTIVGRTPCLHFATFARIGHLANVKQDAIQDTLPSFTRQPEIAACCQMHLTLVPSFLCLCADRLGTSGLHHLCETLRGTSGRGGGVSWSGWSNCWGQATFLG